MKNTMAVVNEVRKIAAERPDFVYATQEGRDLPSSCSYVGAIAGFDGGEGCIVGQALARLGHTKEELFRQEAMSADMAVSRLGYRLSSVGLGYANPEVWLQRVQSEQDRGKSWGEAVANTDEQMKAWGKSWSEADLAYVHETV